MGPTPRNNQDTLTNDEPKVEEPYYKIEMILQWRKVKAGRSSGYRIFGIMEGYPMEEAWWIQGKKFTHRKKLQHYLEEDQPLEGKV